MLQRQREILHQTFEHLCALLLLGVCATAIFADVPLACVDERSDGGASLRTRDRMLN